MDKFRMDLQMFNLEGGAPAGGPVNGGAPAPAQAPAPAAPAPQSQPNTYGQPQGGPAPNIQPSNERPDGHVIRSALQQAEATWQQQNAAALRLAEIVRQSGRDPQQVITDWENQQRQEQTQGIDPRVVQQIQSMQQQMEQQSQYIQNQRRTEAMQQIQTAETGNTELAKKYGIDYNEQVRDSVRQFAIRNDMGLDAAFTMLYRDQLLSAAARASQGETIAQLQGRGQEGQPVSTAVPGTQQQGPVDWRTVSAKDYYAERERIRNGG